MEQKITLPLRTFLECLWGYKGMVGYYEDSKISREEFNLMAKQLQILDPTEELCHIEWITEKPTKFSPKEELCAYIWRSNEWKASYEADLIAKKKAEERIAKHDRRKELEFELIAGIKKTLGNIDEGIIKIMCLQLINTKNFAVMQSYGVTSVVSKEQLEQILGEK